MSGSLAISAPLHRRFAALARGHALGVGLLFASAVALPLACGNPVVDRRIEALGGENPNVPASEHHRPGQPCVLCHSVYEGATPRMSIGGTVFADTVSLLPVEGVQVVMTDTRGITRTAVTNCVGNFFIEGGAWDEDYPDPQFPLAVEIRCPTYDESGLLVVDSEGLPVIRVKSMGSVIAREGSCAACHDMYQGRSLSSTGWIYCNSPEEPNTFPSVREDCPGEAP